VLIKLDLMDNPLLSKTRLIKQYFNYVCSHLVKVNI